MNTPSTLTVPVKVLHADDFASAVALAVRVPECFIQVFVNRWSDVDRLRARAAELGLLGRIGIHHRSALAALLRLDILPVSGPRPVGKDASLPRDVACPMLSH